MSPPVVRDREEMRSWCRAARAGGKTLALVPTMGFLHEGHLSLVRAAREAGADVVVVSIYVNPTQFAVGEDLDVYPRDPEGDHAQLAGVAVDAIFEPDTLYCGPEQPPHETYVTVETLQARAEHKCLCGASRPTHFRGVTTVVAKLFNIVQPDVAVFGRKDYQQFKVLCRMVRDLDFGVRMVGAPLVREADGLALSSRNVRLSAPERARALSISRALRAAVAQAEGGQREVAALRAGVVAEVQSAGGEVDYVEVVSQESLQPMEGRLVGKAVILVAARFGSVRLLDNAELS